MKRVCSIDRVAWKEIVLGAHYFFQSACRESALVTQKSTESQNSTNEDEAQICVIQAPVYFPSLGFNRPFSASCLILFYLRLRD